MSLIGSKEGEVLVDIENGLGVSADDSIKEPTSGEKIASRSLLAKVREVFVDGSTKDEERSANVVNHNGVSAEHVKMEGGKTDDHAEKKIVKEKRKKASNKKAPKPPRPPRGPSLDAADQKLIKEIAEVAMLKRARVERMKALKKVKATKPSSNSNMFAMVFTAMFFLVILIQGMSSRVTHQNLPGSPVSTETAEGGLISVQYLGNPSASDPNGPSSVSSNSVEPVAGSDPLGDIPRRARG